MTATGRIIIGDSRRMLEVAAESVDLVVTSPPYWHIKDYGVAGQIGYGQSLHEYLKDLYYVWQECFRVLRPGSRLCLNIGDQFARATVYGRYKIIPLHAEFIGQGEEIGFDFLGAIIWQKKTTMNTTGGAVVMGSYPFPPNGLIEIDYEFILIFKKPGQGRRVSREVKEASKLTKEEWKEYFSGHWYFGGARQIGHEAMFPEELPRRLIKMFTFAGDTVLDPFLGSGTTVKAALELGRSAAGYEINPDFVAVMEEKLGLKDRLPFFQDIQLSRPEPNPSDFPLVSYRPRLKDAHSLKEAQKDAFVPPDLHKVVRIMDEGTILLENGERIQFLGVQVSRGPETLQYLTQRLLGKAVYLKSPQPVPTSDGVTRAYVYLKNRLFINAYLIKAGLGSPDEALPHRFARRFRELHGAWVKK